MKVVLIILVSLQVAVALPNLNDVWKMWSGSKETIKSAPRSREKRQSVNIGDKSRHPYEVSSSLLPRFRNGSINHRYMPTLGNGLLGTTVYHPYVYVNGLYNGAGAESHRAAIPAVIMTRIVFDDELEKKTQRTYSFNVQDGVFLEKIDCPYATIYHRTYIHHKYIRLLVTDIYAEKRDTQSGSVFDLSYAKFNSCLDVQFERERLYENEWQISGQTKVAEFGSQLQRVHAYFMEPVKSISLRGSNRNVNETMIMSLDTNEAAAKSDFDRALRVLNGPSGSWDLLSEHTEAWHKTWEQGKIEVDGNPQLAKAVNFAQYYILASMPPLFPAQAPPFETYTYSSFARTSIGKGGSKADYNGHVFWDSEMYILPALVLLHPELAKSILLYRASRAQQAKDHAAAINKEGYRFPWESARTGRDVTPNDCTSCRDQSHHATGAVAHAIRLYYSATRDQAYLKSPHYGACDMSVEIARFFASLAEYNSETGRYDIKGAMGPDDWHPDVTNSAYTNALASLSIHWGHYMACLCGGSNSQELDEWVNIALQLGLPFDNVKRVHYQYDGAEGSNNVTNKQADVVMLGWPLNWNMSEDIIRHDLEFYDIPNTDDRTPAMSWSWFAIGWKWADEQAKAINYFEKSYMDYMIEPFKVWTEYNERNENDQEHSAVNYLPGMGAFLQSVLYGFAGIRIRPQMLEFHNPQPPPNSHGLRLTGFNYQGATMDIEITTEKVVIQVIDTDPMYALVLKRNDTYGASNAEEESLTAGALVTIQNRGKGFWIYSKLEAICQHPLDYTYMPWGYSHQTDAAEGIHGVWTARVLTSLLLCVLCFVLEI